MNGPTLDEIKQWPATCSVREACIALGNISKSHGYNLIKRGQFPVRVIKVGTRIRVSVADLVRALDVGPEESRE